MARVGRRMQPERSTRSREEAGGVEKNVEAIVSDNTYCGILYP